MSAELGLETLGDELTDKPTTIANDRRSPTIALVLEAVAIREGGREGVRGRER